LRNILLYEVFLYFLNKV